MSSSSSSSPLGTSSPSSTTTTAVGAISVTSTTNNNNNNNKSKTAILWPKSTIFDHGLLGFPTKHLGFSSIIAVMEEVKRIQNERLLLSSTTTTTTTTTTTSSSGGGEYEDLEPLRLSKDWFIPTACEYFRWTSTEAELCFSHFEILYDIEYASIVNIVDDEEEAEFSKRARFCMFLVLQMFSHRKVRRSSLTVDAAQWKQVMSNSAIGGTSSSSTQDEFSQQMNNPHQQAIHARQNEWALRLEFLKKNIRQIIELVFLQVPTLLTGKKKARLAFNSLGFMIGGAFADGITRAIRLSDLLPMTMNFENLDETCEWFLSHLALNEDYNVRWTDEASNSVVKNSQDFKHPLIIRGIGRRALVVLDEQADSSRTRNHVVIATCKGSTIYLLQACNYAHIVGCVDSTIILGPVFGVLSTEHCERIKVIAPCGRLRVLNCVDMSFSFYSPNRPIIVGDCRNIVLGPHNTNFSGLRSQILSSTNSRTLGLNNVHSNHWKFPYIVDVISGVTSVLSPAVASEIEGGGTSDSSSSNSGSSGIVEPSNIGGDSFSLLPPESFQINHVPTVLSQAVSSTSSAMIAMSTLDHYVNQVQSTSNVDSTGNSTLDPLFFPLPSEYAEALAQTKLKVANLLKYIQESSVQHGGQVQNAVQGAFKDWLVVTGNIRHVMDLVRLQDVSALTKKSSSGQLSDPGATGYSPRDSKTGSFA